MSIKNNIKVKEVVADQVQQITQQIKNNAPELLKSEGAAPVLINVIPSNGCSITEPGTYKLGNNINWTPELLFSAAIVIQCNDVVLDFQGHNLTAVGEFQTTSLGVIVFNSHTGIPCDNVTVQNGTIQNMGLYGLLALNTFGLNISDITIDGLTYPNFDFLPSAISLVGASDFTIENSNVNSVDVTAMMASGFMVIDGILGKISNCTVTELTNNDGIACGFPYFESAGIVTHACTVNKLTTVYGGNALSKFGHTCIGFMPANCSALIFSDCVATEINGCCDDCHGISLFPVNGAVVSNFTANGVHDGLGPQQTGAKATGVEVYGSNITVKNSHVTNITAIVPQDLQSTGFSACGTNITFESCTATGVAIHKADEIKSNTSPSPSLGYGTGFGWAPDPRKQYALPSHQITYKNCSANNCQLGFDTWNHQNSSWINPVATGCGLSHLIQTTTASRVYSMNFCSELSVHGVTPNTPPKNFTIPNQIKGNTYPEAWTEG